MLARQLEGLSEGKAPAMTEDETKGRHNHLGSPERQEESLLSLCGPSVPEAAC